VLGDPRLHHGHEGLPADEECIGEVFGPEAGRLEGHVTDPQGPRDQRLDPRLDLGATQLELETNRLPVGEESLAHRQGGFLVHTQAPFGGLGGDLHAHQGHVVLRQPHLAFLPQALVDPLDDGVVEVFAPKKVSPAVASTTRRSCRTSITDTSKVPPPRS